MNKRPTFKLRYTGDLRTPEAAASFEAAKEKARRKKTLPGFFASNVVSLIRR